MPESMGDVMDDTLYRTVESLHKEAGSFGTKIASHDRKVGLQRTHHAATVSETLCEMSINP